MNTDEHDEINWNVLHVICVLKYNVHDSIGYLSIHTHSNNAETATHLMIRQANIINIDNHLIGNCKYLIDNRFENKPSISILKSPCCQLYFSDNAILHCKHALVLNYHQHCRNPSLLVVVQLKRKLAFIIWLYIGVILYCKYNSTQMKMKDRGRHS